MRTIEIVFNDNVAYNDQPRKGLVSQSASTGKTLMLP